MNVRWLFFVLLFLPLFSSRGWSAQRSYPVASRPKEDLNSLTYQVKSGMTELKNDVRNHESEIRTFEEKLQNQETAFEQLRQQVTDELQVQKDFAKASNINLEGKTETLDDSIKNLETLFKGVTADCRQLKDQANDSVAVLGQYKQKLSELEKLLETQNQHMRSLESALQTMMEVLQAKATARETAYKNSDGAKTYKVQSGDTLEKIARNQKITLQELREYNHLANDRIIVGQTLKIP